MVQAAAYTRFSSDMQDGNSTDTQVRTIQEYAASHDCNIVAHYKDEGTSGRSGDRVGFMQMIADIKSGKTRIEVLLVYKFSRFMRNLEESIVYKKKLEMLGVKVISVTEPLPDESAVGKLTENILGCIDQFYSDMLSGLCLEGQKQVVLNKYWPGGPPPFGYKLKKIGNAEGHSRKGQIVERNVLEINPDEARIVKRLFEISAQTGKGGHLVYLQLSQELGCPVLGRHGKPLGGRGVNDILRKKIYAGTFIYNSHGFRLVIGEDGKARKQRIAKDQSEWIEVQDENWRIISDELWIAAEASRIANQRADFGFGDRKASYPLTGLVTCECCGGKFAGHWQRSKNSQYYYYRCRNAMNGEQLCGNRMKLPGDAFDSFIVQQIVNDLLNDSFVESVALEIVRTLKDDSGDQNREDLERKLAGVKLEIDRLITLAKKVGDLDALATELDRCRINRKELEASLNRVASQTTPPSIEELRPQIQTALRHARSLFTSPADVKTLRWELSKWIEAISITADGHITVKWKPNGLTELLDFDQHRN